MQNFIYSEHVSHYLKCHSFPLKHSMCVCVCVCVCVCKRKKSIALNGLFAIESFIPKFNESLPMYVEQMTHNWQQYN
jgi:hypothetical protein